MKDKIFIALWMTGAAALGAAAQTVDDGTPNKVTVHGSVQADILIPTEDVTYGGYKYNDDVMLNFYTDASLYSKFVDAGVRFEYLEHPLPGFEPDFKGWGVPNFWVKGKYGGVELTVGDFYEQFGSGFILRTYEERSLGVDNPMRGARVTVNSIAGMRFTALGGVQRIYWDWEKKDIDWGLNYEIDLQHFIKSMDNHGASLTLGASFVDKYEKDENVVVPGTNYRLDLPHHVPAWDARVHYLQNGFDVLAEYAWKGQDPSLDNDYTYGKGSAVMLSTSYSRSGLSVFAQAKRSENFAFRSRRTMTGIAGYINNMPPFAYQHTYALAAMYPYATQAAPGEWAFQGAVAYKFKKGTPMGGKYGTTFRLNGSWIRGLTGTEPEKFHGTYYGTDGVDTKFFGMGAGYYHDINLQMEKRIVSNWNLTAMYMNQMYNQQVVEGHGERSIKSNIFVADSKVKINKKFTLRNEVQYLQTKQDHGDWLYGLAELSILPHWMISVSDQWNCGGGEGHFYNFSLTANFKSNRIMVGYGRTRAGYNCSGGVCRYVPETKGFTINYNYNF
ncbi:MAG: DUF6029 family protein [Bacteroidales bacterium]|nr:DUF6029 family protein [Bacteroidales bacterium]